ncbi:histone deacetylase interacting domain-containing protein, putative [Eimeria mitis]|uniref:Histone deacetylase interacting domain-containing protein, putative n=1 Tax=Eimeria mitis TaxID=44415 RepID=U6K3W7_9EIME|nr:histone deacetylase interacting domain-containing protein, putative [Eimeria mitis]CDJ31027.1 histone deacetylase interacting domain-containing protein, putative [Eimeria mitis]
MGPPPVARQSAANDALHSVGASPDAASPPSTQSSTGGAAAPRVKAEAAQAPPQTAPSEPATSDDFHLMWSELEAYLTKRFSGGPQSLVSLRRVLEHVKRQRLRVEELAFLIGNSFPDAPDVSLCMSLFLPDRTLIHAGNPAAAMCILIQNMAPDKYAIFNSILKSCMAQKTQRGSRDILLHRMQLLFRGHPLVIRAIRKLLVQQFCIEKNGGVIRKNQALELAKPFDDEPVQVHSVFRLAYQVGLSGGCAERARVLASNVLHLVRMLLSRRLAFSSFSDEVDRIFASFPSWFHVAGDIKQLILTVSKRDQQTSKEIERLVKLLAARNPAACCDRRVGLLHLCDLFLHGVSTQSLSLRIEIDHLISRFINKDISASLALQRIAALLRRHPDSAEKLGVLIRLFKDIHANTTRNDAVNTTTQSNTATNSTQETTNSTNTAASATSTTGETTTATDTNIPASTATSETTNTENAMEITTNTEGDAATAAAATEERTAADAAAAAARPATETNEMSIDPPPPSQGDVSPEEDKTAGASGYKVAYEWCVWFFFFLRQQQ